MAKQSHFLRARSWQSWLWVVELRDERGTGGGRGGGEGDVIRCDQATCPQGQICKYLSFYVKKKMHNFILNICVK